MAADKISHRHADVDASSMPAAAVQPLRLQSDNSSTSTSSAVSSLTSYTSPDTSCQDSHDVHSKPLGSTDTSSIDVSGPSTVARRRTRDWSLAQEPTTDAPMVADKNLRSKLAAPRESLSPTSSLVSSSVPKSPTETRAANSLQKLDMDTSQLVIDNLREAVNVAQVSSYQHLDRKSPGGKKPMGSPIDQSPLKLRDATVLPFPDHTQPAAQSTAKVQSMPARAVAKAAPMAGFSSVPTEFIPNYDDLEIPTPKLYDIALQLNADPGVGEYWRNLTKILETFYMAKRVSLIAPNDLTDIANTPWGLKGVWTSKSLPWALSRLQHHRGSQVAECIEREADNKKEDTVIEDEEDWEDMFDETENTFERPDKVVTRDSDEDTDAEYSSTSVEPTTLSFRQIRRHKSDGDTFDNHTAGDIAGEISENEDLPFLSRRQTDVTHGIARIYSALRPLESDIDPLIDSLGVSRVLQRGKVVLLQREYRNFQDTATEATQPTQSTGKSRRYSTALSPSRRGSVQSNTGDECVTLERPQLSHRNAFAEKDRLKTKLKAKLRDPFDDVGVNLMPQSASADLPYEDYEQALLSPWSHSPAPSPAVSKDNQENPFFISTLSPAEDAFASTEETATMSPLADMATPVRAIGLESSYSVIHIPLIHPSISRSVRAPGSRKRHIVPIAIISILSDVIPYPMNLVKSLTAFAPHMASSYSLAEAYSNLRYQIEMTKKINSHHYLEGSRYHNHKHHHRPSRKSSVMTHRSSTFDGVGSGSYSQLSDSGGSSATSTPTWETSGTLYDAAGVNNTMTSPTISSSSKTSTPGPYFSATTSVKASTAITPDGPSPDIGSQPPSQYTVRRTGKPNNGSGSLRSTSPPPKSPISSFSTSTSPAPTPYTARSIGQEPQRLSGRKSASWSQMPPPSPRLLRTIIDSIPVHLYIAEPDTGAITWVSARALAYCGLTPEDYCRQPQIRRFHPDDQSMFERAWRNALKKGDSLSLQLRIRRFDGAYRYFAVRAVPLRDSKGSIVHWFGTNMDIHDQRMAEFESYKQSEKLASERKYRTLAESSPLIVFTATEKGGLTYANNQWLQYSGQTVDDVKKFGFLANVHPDDREKCALPNASKESQFSTEIRLRNAAGQYKWHLVRCVCAGAVGLRLSAASNTPGFKTEGATEFPGISGPVSTNSDDDQTADLAWFGTCTDINEHKLVEEKLQEAKDAAQRTMESKARFLSNMSHEIRTPLIGISGMVNFLMDTTLTAEQLDYCHTISSSSEALLSVINDILDLSKAEAGKMRLNKEWFHIRWLIEDANELLSTLAISKNLELNYIVEEDVPPLVKGDRIRIRQVLLNIIGNAIKFTSRGEIFTRCSVQKRNQNSIMLHFECHDTGAGFTKEDEDLMFKPFSQIDGTMTRKHGGSGLGLVISRQLIELHGGTINCRGEKGKGSTFYFSAEFGLPTEEDRQFSSPRPRSGSHRCSSSSAASADSTVHHVGDKHSPLSLRPTASTVQQTESVSTPQSLPSPMSEYPLSLPLTPGVLSPGSIAPNMSSTTAERQKNIQFKGIDPRNMLFRIPSDARKCKTQGEQSPEALTLSPESTLSAEEAGSEKSRVFAVVVCEYPFTTEAIIHHIRESLPSDTILETSHVTNYEAACDLISVLGSHPSGSDPRQPFTHVVINVPDYTEIVSLAAKVFFNTEVYANTKVVAITTPMQKTAILQNMRADASGASSTIPEKSNLSIDVTALSDKDHALPLTQGDPGRSSTLVDYKILEKEYATRFYCVSKPLKVSRMAAVFNPSRAISGGAGSFQSSLEDKSGSKEQSSVASRRKATSRKSIFRGLQAAVGDKGYHVLLVEDNPVNQKVLHQFLARGGLTVDTVADGEECVQKVYSSGLGYYDLIICDLHMPRKDGFHTCAELRRWEDENEVVDRVPIVALSANVMSDVAEKCAMVGFSRYVSKPIDFIVFKDVIVELLQGNQASGSSEDLST
ncbi:uncharacterized protein V1513DRAFT_397029 [Lipomyces chichibuensis]|uniref:uncharacterized protein n=1 Tax=Lipomyces chichibuensis TaxID=1546026 RepID=UPI0033442CBF